MNLLYFYLDLLFILTSNQTTMKILLSSGKHGLLFLLLAFFGATISIGQTGPAGVGSIANNIIWLDVHAMGFANGAPIGTLSDFSGNGNNFTQTSSAKMPTNTSGALNGFPVASFDGVNDALSSGTVANLNTNELTYFIVYQKSSFTSQCLINANSSAGSAKWRSYSNYNSDKIFAVHYSPSISHLSANDANVGSYIHYNANSSGSELFKEGVLAQTKTAAYTAPTGINNIFLGNFFNSSTTNSYMLNGYIAEVVVFNSNINSLEKVLVENYLAAKYGLSAPTDLYAFEGTHNVELVGIGDDGTNAQSIAKGKGVMQFSLPTAMSTNEFLLAAHTDVPLSDFNTVDLPAALVTSGHQRWNRTWRVDETGDVGTTTITFELAGVNDFGASTSYRLLVDTDGVFTDATVVTGVYAAGSVSFTHDFTDGDFFTLAGIEDILEIHSQIDGNWSSPLTWDCACIPGSNDDVYIDPLTSVTLDVDGTAKYMEISANGKLNINTDVTLTLQGELEILGTLDMTDGTISLDGSDPQYIELNGQTVNFNNISINNTSGSNIDLFGGTYILNGKLSPNSGTTAVDGGATFIVNSTSATTGGRIGQLLSPAALTGTFSVRRFIQGGTADYRNMCSPVVGATFDDWDPDIFMSGPGFPDGCANGPNGCFKSVKYFENGNYQDVLNSTDPILNNRGFELFLGDDLNTFSATTITSTGTLNTSADIVKSMNTGYSIVGNPYACPITFNTITKQSPIGNYYYVYDAAAGAYQWYDGSSSSSSVPEITGNGLIPIGQGVWVFASSLSNMTIKQSDKSDDDATFIRSNQQAVDFQITLAEQASTYNCVMALQPSSIATDGVDSLMDIRHLATGHEKAPGIAFDFGTEDVYRKNYYSEDGKNKSFNLFANFINEGYHSISAKNFEVIDNYHNVFIFDAETNEFYNLLEGGEYVFYAEQGVSNRFSLILSNETAESNILGVNSVSELTNDLSIVQMGNMINIESIDNLENVSIILYNSLGQETYRFEKNNLNSGDNLITIPSGISGVHILSVNFEENRISKKLVF